DLLLSGTEARVAEHLLEHLAGAREDVAARLWRRMALERRVGGIARLRCGTTLEPTRDLAQRGDRLRRERRRRRAPGVAQLGEASRAAEVQRRVGLGPRREVLQLRDRRLDLRRAAELRRHPA